MLFLTLSSQNPAAVDSTLHVIDSLYNSARYVDAELESRRLREEPLLSDSIKVLIEKWIAFSLIAQGKTAPARERFISLLWLDPDFELDPVLTSPKILSVFNDARVKYLSHKRSQSDSMKTDTQRVLRSVTYRAALFPGWEQLYTGRTTSGSFFLGAGAITLGSGIAFEILRANARDEYLKETVPTDIASKYDRYNSYRKAEIYSFIGFAIVYIASEVDVFSNSGSPDIAFRPTYNPLSGNSLTLSVIF